MQAQDEQYQWNKKDWRGQPYWVKNYKGIGQGRIERCKDFFTWVVYLFEGNARKDGESPTLGEARDAVDNLMAKEAA